MNDHGDLTFHDDGQTIQVNLHRVTKPGLFVVFPSSERDKAIGWARFLAERDDLEDNTDITDQVPGALAAGVTQSIKMVLGNPEVKHA